MGDGIGGDSDLLLPLLLPIEATPFVSSAVAKDDPVGRSDGTWPCNVLQKLSSMCHGVPLHVLFCECSGGMVMQLTVNLCVTLGGGKAVENAADSAFQ